MGMKYSHGKPKLLIQADDFYDFMSQEASAFFASIKFIITLKEAGVKNTFFAPGMENYYAYIFITYISGRTRHGCNLPEIETATNHRHAYYRYCPWAICT